MTKSKNKKSRTYIIFFVLLPMLGAVFALPGQGLEYLYTWRCISTMEDCERSFVAPSTVNIFSEKLNRLNRSKTVVNRIAISEKRPIFGKPGIKVSAVVGDESEEIGYFETSDVASVVAYERSDLLRSAVFVPAAPKYFASGSSVDAKLHLFDINSGILHTEIEFGCSAEYSADFRIFNMRWGEAQDGNTLSADFASNCDYIEITGKGLLSSSLYDDTKNGRLFLKFDDQLVLSDYWTANEICVKKQKKQYELAMDSYRLEEKRCIDQAEVNSEVVGFSGECLLTGPEHPYSCESGVELELVSFIGLAAAGNRISENMYCDMSVLERNIVNKNHAYMLCGKTSYAGSRGAFLYIDVARFDKTPVRLIFSSNANKFSIRGIEIISDNTIEFDIFSDSDKFVLQDIELSVEAQMINEEFSNPYRGRFGAVFSDTEALLDFYKK